MAGYTTRNKTFDTGALHDSNVVVLGDGYGANARYAGVDGYGNSYVTSHEGQPEHFNGTVGTTAIDINITLAKSTALLINNPSTNANSDLLQVSFDGGINYFDIERKGRLEIETEISTFKLKSNNAGTDYQIIATRIIEA